MSEQERYVDPNSGAAPQPGSWAGEQAVPKGFGPPPVDPSTGSGALEEEPVPSAYEAIGEQPVAETVSEQYPALSDEAAQAEVDAVDHDEVPEELQSSGSDEEKAAADAAVEHGGTLTPDDIVGINPSVDEGVAPPDQPADGDGNPVDAGEPEQDADQAPDADFDAGNSRAPKQPEAKDYTDLLAGSIPDVEEYLEAHPDEKEAVQAAEAAGEGRKGIANL